MTAHGALAQRIDADADALARASLDAMYEDPFWEARFGVRGRRFAAEDARHHVRYLVDALRGGDEGHLVGYARWLQTVLTTRGMCSAHLGEHFERLGEAVEARLGDEAAPAVVMLRAAAAALRHHGDAAAVEREAERRADSWATGGQARAHGVAEALARRDARHVASFLADAVALGRAEYLAAHVRWLARQTGRAGRPAAYVSALVDHFAGIHGTAPALAAAHAAFGASPTPASAEAVR